MLTNAPPFFVGKLCVALSCGLVAGVFFAFSTFVMRALARLQPAQGIAAMQAINISAVSFWFMLLFMGTAAASLFFGILALMKWQQTDAAWLLGGSLIYLIGVFLVTVACNVPLNDALAKVEAGSAQGAQLWASYLNTWVMWNHVRTVGSLAATACFIMSLCQRAAPS